MHGYIRVEMKIEVAEVRQKEAEGAAERVPSVPPVLPVHPNRATVHHSAAFHFFHARKTRRFSARAETRHTLKPPAWFTAVPPARASLFG